MNHYQSHKIVEAARIVEFNRDPEGSYTVVFEDGTDEVLDPELGERMKQMAIDAGTTVNGGWQIEYPDSYTSWSPHEAFVDGYDLVQPSSGRSKILGYRELTEIEINGLNACKELGISLGELIAKMREKDLDQRWVSIGATHFQEGLMALSRAITKPEFF